MRKIFKGLSLLLISLGIVYLPSCSDKITEVYYQDGSVTESFTKEYPVNAASEWNWNDIEQRYETTFFEKDYDEFLHNKGAILGSVFVEETFIDDNNQPMVLLVKKPLPFIKTYTDGGGRPYTITISCDVAYVDNPQNEGGDITYYIQSSDIVSADKFIGKYNFILTFLAEEYWQDKGYKIN